MKNKILILFAVVLFGCHKDSTPQPAQAPAPVVTSPYTDTDHVTIGKWNYIWKGEIGNHTIQFQGYGTVPDYTATSQTTTAVYIGGGSLWTKLPIHNWLSTGDSLYCLPALGQIEIIYSEGADSINLTSSIYLFKVNIYHP